MPTRSPTGPTVNPVRSIMSTVALASAITVLGCMGSVQVRTQTAPGANIAALRTFRILPTPAARGVSLDPIDPMRDNSITNRSIREDIRAAFESRGYSPSPANPDFTIAYYATTRPKLDVTTWDYGYTWRGWPREYTEVTQYEQGTVLLDVVDAKTNELLWRGQGVAVVSTDPAAYQRELGKAVNAIMKRWPGAHVGTP